MSAGIFATPASSSAPVVAVHDWAGSYIGVLGGGTYDRYRIYDQYGGTYRSFSGPALGIFGGYNWQSSNLVYGFDGSIGYRFGKSTIHMNGGPGSMETRLGWEGSLRGRIGLDMGAFLPYIAAGATATQLRTFWPAGYVHRGATLVGWTAAIGADVKVTNQIFLRGEYAYSNYGPKKLEYCGALCSMSYKPQNHDFLIGVGYKF
ncbi:MAG: outer membrane protein [Rhizobiaceae bacterium]